LKVEIFWLALMPLPESPLMMQCRLTMLIN
jgi:hypothetical protein